MKIIVAPERDRDIVVEVLHDAFERGHIGGTANLTFTVMRHLSAPRWSVRATGLGDPILEASYSDIAREALDRALP